MLRKGRSPDNSRMEGFFGTLKNEMFYGRDWSKATLEELGAKIDAHIVWHSEKRRKRLLGGMSPLQYRRSLGARNIGTRYGKSLPPPRDHDFLSTGDVDENPYQNGFRWKLGCTLAKRERGS